MSHKFTCERCKNEFWTDEMDYTQLIDDPDRYFCDQCICDYVKDMEKTIRNHALIRQFEDGESVLVNTKNADV